MDRLKFRLSVLFGAWTEGGHRDWNAISKQALKDRPILSWQTKETVTFGWLSLFLVDVA